MAAVREISDVRYFLEKIDDDKLSKVLSLPYFSNAYSQHISKKNIFNIEEVIATYKNSGIKEKEVITLCRLCDFLNWDVSGYIPIVKEQAFNIKYEYLSTYDNRSVTHSLVIQSNFIDLTKIISELLHDTLVYEKLNDSEFLLDKCISNTTFIQKEEVNNFIINCSQKISFIGRENELDKLLDLFENISRQFSHLTERYFLVNALNLVVSLLPSDIKNAKVYNLVRRTNGISNMDKKLVFQFLEDSRITKLAHLSKLKCKDVSIEILRTLAYVIDSNKLNSPRRIQENVFSGFKERDQQYSQMRFEKCMKYNEIGAAFGFTRSAAQSALAKIGRRLRNPVRLKKLYEMMEQVLLFADNDYFITKEQLEMIGVWKGLLEELFSVKKYKNSELLIIDGLSDKLLNFDEESSNEEDIDKNASDSLQSEQYEFSFLKTLPSIIKKKELNKYIDIVIENSKKMITKKDVKTVIDLNYRDYNTIISKTRLNISYCMKQILQTYFPDGLDVYDTENLNKIRKLLQELYNYSIDEYSDRYITHRICMVSTLIGRGMWKYNPEQIELSQELISKINNYIEGYPISAVPIKSIFEEFSDDLLDFGIENRYALQGVLKKSIKSEFKTTRDYIYTDDSQTFTEIIAEFIKNSKLLVTREVLEKEFPGFSLTSMQQVINTSSVVNMNGYFASMDNFNFTNEEISELKYELEQIVLDEEAHNTKNIFYKFKNKFNGLFNRIGINHYLQFYYIVNKLFDEDFEFLRPFIAKKGIEIQDKETQLIELIVEAGSVSIDELRELASRVGYLMESIMDLVIHNNDEIVFKDEENIIAINKIELDEEKMAQIDTVLDKFMLYCDYKYLTELANFNEIKEILPISNKWFLYSIISAYSTKYKIFRTSNVMSRTELIIAKEDFDIKSIEILHEPIPEIFDLEDLLEIEDLE